MSQMLDYMACDEGRCNLLNTLCRMYSRQRMAPNSMRADEYPNREPIEEYNGAMRRYPRLNSVAIQWLYRQPGSI